jgi:inner membrane protein
MGHTHAVMGALTGALIAAHAGSSPSSMLLLAGTGAIAALLADIDHPRSMLRQRAGLLGTLAFWWLPHRGVTHTLWALLLVGVIAHVLAPGTVALVIGLAFASHLLLDMLTPVGIHPLLPLRWRLRSPVTIRTGGRIEWLFGAALSVSLVVLLVNFISL